MTSADLTIFTPPPPRRTSIGEDDVLDDMRHAGSAEVIPGFSEAWCDGLFNDTHSSSGQ